MSSCRKLRNSQEKAKTDAEPFKDKSSSCILRGNDEKSPSKLQVSIESSPLNKASNTGVAMNPDVTVPSTRAHSSENHDVCTPFALRLPHNTHTAVSCMPYLPGQAMKPSGLRRPSPSLGFFRQTKASDTHRLLKDESSMCPLQRSGDLRPPETLARQEGKDNLANLNSKILGSESESSTAVCKVIKTGLEGNSVERVNIPSSVTKKFDLVSDKFRDHVGNFDDQVPDHIQHEEKKLQDAELLMNNRQHPPQMGKHEHINKDGDLMNSIPGFIENKGSAGSDFRDAQFPQASYNTQSLVLCRLEDGNPNEAEEFDISSKIDGLICNPQHGNMINFSGEVMKEGYMGGCDNLTGREFENVKSFAVDDDGLIDNDKYIMKIKSNLSKVQRELRNNGGGNCESLNLIGSDFSEVKMEKSEVAYQHEDSHNLKEAYTSKQITDRVQTRGLVADISNETLSDENCETDPGGLSIYSKHKFQGGSVLHSSDQSLSKHACTDQSQDGQIDKTGLSALPYRSDESACDRFDETSAQTELEGNRITVVGEDPADIMCFSPVKITLPGNCNHSTNEDVNRDKILANSTSCLEFGSSYNRTRDKMVSDVPGSIDERKKPIIESVLEVVDETETHNSLNCHKKGNLTSSMEFGSSSRGMQNVIGSAILDSVGVDNKLINSVFLSNGMDDVEIQDFSNKPDDGNQIIKLKLGMLSPESLIVEESQMCNPIELGYHKVLSESIHTPPKLGDTRRANEVGKTTNALTNILQIEDSESSQNELFHGLEDTEQCTNDDTILPVKNTESCLKKGNLLILPPRDAVPFSDEWLAAMEAAGEDILTMKGGAVQNSPQEKSLPEPSPWSPVKKKNNQLGPYDCTKFHHNGPPKS